MTDKYEVRIQQVIDRYIQASYGLWNALLTVNGLILAAATMVSGDQVSYLKLLVVVLALVSIALLTYNYVAMKLTYFRIGEVVSGNPDDLTSEKKEKDISLSLARNKRVKWFENSCLGILFVQALLLVASFACAIA
ncbi:hypothetical protein [Vreelandella lutescens]|uniref:DUF3899 domain-containing protein n=1 Tax=Vreelandella lutescens TaxID=1602943 RepID=A0ABQ1PHR6_9GAMM|nr:hypothetical protein [Halomonas lutescens]GGC97495.1 hypothetical protein GCM10011382_29990 [Halomonas lutescens]